MRVNIGILIGKGSKAWASKTIDLSFAPTPEMRYDDATWKDTGGREISSVTIEYDPDAATYLSVALKPDASDEKDNLVPRYTAHDWTIT